MRLLLMALVLCVGSCVHQSDGNLPSPPVVSEKPPGAKPASPVAPPKAPALPPLASPGPSKPLIIPERPGEALTVENELPRAIELMLKKAEAQFADKQLSLARAQAERAYRMESQNRDPRISFLLARIAAEEGDFGDAEQWAHRSLETAESSQNKDLLWRFIARCRQKQGNSSGAMDALRRQ
jgi:hypothetical protein